MAKLKEKAKLMRIHIKNVKSQDNKKSNPESEIQSQSNLNISVDNKTRERRARSEVKRKTQKL